MIQILLMAVESEEDRRFVESFYLEQRKRLKIYAYQIVKDEDLADDCVQDVFKAIIEILERFETFPLEDQIKYITICVRNSAIAKCKDRSKYVSLTAESDSYNNAPEYEVADDSADVCDIVINGELKEKLRKHINSLPMIYRDVMIYRFEYELKGKEISSALFISEDVVRQRIRRGKELLKKRGGKELYDLFKWTENW